MKNVKKALCSGLFLACVTMLIPTFSQAQEQTQEPTSKPRAILFKLHEIKPVIDTEGQITHCDFMATFYNRTDESLRHAKIEMGWTDNISDRFVAEWEKQENTEKNNNKKDVTSSRTTRNVQETLGEITTSIDVPSLGAHKQATIKGSVKTEKCFALLDSMDFRVVSCGMVGKENPSQNIRRRAAAVREVSAECSNLFEYIDSKNPEYYDEFQNISFSEQERLIESDRLQDVGDLDETYNQVVKNFEDAEKIINNIQ